MDLNNASMLFFLVLCYYSGGLGGDRFCCVSDAVSYMNMRLPCISLAMKQCFSVSFSKILLLQKEKGGGVVCLCFFRLLGIAYTFCYNEFALP